MLTTLFGSPPPPPPFLSIWNLKPSNGVSAEVIDSSHTENAPDFSVNGAEPGSGRARETCKQFTAELSGPNQTQRRGGGRGTLEQIIVLLGKKAVNNISTQGLAIHRDEDSIGQNEAWPRFEWKRFSLSQGGRFPSCPTPILPLSSLK